ADPQRHIAAVPGLGAFYLLRRLALLFGFGWVGWVSRVSGVCRGGRVSRPSRIGGICWSSGVSWVGGVGRLFAGFKRRVRTKDCVLAQMVGFKHEEVSFHHRVKAFQWRSEEHKSGLQ